MQRLNLTIPKEYKKRLKQHAKEKELSVSELLRHWIDEKVSMED